MKRYFTSIKDSRQLLLQVLFVFAAFFVMVVIGSTFGAQIIGRNVESYGKEVINTAGETINTYLDEYRFILEDVAFSLIMLKGEGAGTERMQESVEAWTERLRANNRKFENFSGFYGIVDGEFIDGSGWDPMNPESEDYDPDYKPQDRPWFTGAGNSGGRVYYSDPYIDADTGEYVLTASKMLIYGSGNYLGIIAMDFYLEDIENIINSLTLLESGFGVLLDSERRIIVTKNLERKGMYFDDIDEGHAEVGRLLDTARGAVVHSQVFTDGEEHVVFFKRLPNNWYIGIASPRENYYSDSNLMILVLSLAGLLMALPLAMVLVYLHIKKVRADEASNLKTSFLANMSHEIRTPMNAIIGMTELMQNEHLSEQQEGYIKDINMSAQALLTIINDILDLSKIEAGKIELRPADYDFTAFIDNIVSMFSYVASEKQLDFRFEKSGELPECLYGDDVRLRQVLTNLCGNAAKFTNKGQISLSVIAGLHEISFVIKDTGMGIRKEDMPKLWSPFEQFDMQSNRKIIGTGLGLSISKNFVEMMGGSIDVESVYGSGTAFTVTIPLVPGNMEAALELETPEDMETFIAPDARVLIVDDNEVNLKVASGLLRNIYKIDAQTALSGKDAIDLVSKNEYDVIFMDHMMPEMDGIQTVCEIRRLFGKSREMKYIALTANAITGVREMFIENGFDCFISKPIDMSQLHAALLRTLPPAAIVTAEKVSADAIPMADSSGTFRSAVGAAVATMNAASGGSDSVELGIRSLEPGAKNAGDDAGSDFMSALNGIDAINAEIALSRVSGFEDMLRETVGLFYNKLPGECTRLEQFAEAEDMKNFAISVHGLKSALSAVGAMELSEAAFELEKASKNGETLYCTERLPGFLTKLRALGVELAGVFDAGENSGEIGKLKVESGKPGAGETGSPELFAEKIQQAIAACDDFDDVAALGALDVLLKLDYGAEKNALLKKAKAALKDFDYDTALEVLEGLI